MKEGYIMIQQSVYAKLALNQSIVDSSIQKVKKIRPSDGLVQILVITEKQYASIINITGKIETNTINSDSDLVIL